MKRTASFVKSRKTRQLKDLDTVTSLLEWARKFLKNLGPVESKASAERLLEEVLGCERSFLFLNQKETVSKPLSRRYRSFIQKRQRRIPVAYLLRKSYFWDEVLEVNEHCLIPRPETEILVESFIQRSGFEKNSRFSFLDMGCGSGIIGIAIARSFPNSHVTFCDISRKALAVTRRNAKRYGLLQRSRFIASNLFSFWKKPEKIWDAVVSNPPYVSGGDYAGLEPELKYEPKIALVGGKDGQDFYRRIGREAKQFLKPGGVLFFEMGAGQARSIKSFIVKQGYKTPEVFKDYLKIDRVLMARV